MPQSPEQQLAYLGFQRVIPNLMLRPFIRSYWYLRNRYPLATYHEEYMHPSGGFGVIFNFGDKVSLDRVFINEPIFLDGVNTVSRLMGFHGQINLLGIRFHVGGAFPFFAVPLTELRNAIALLEVQLKPSLIELHARLFEASSLFARIQLLEHWLMTRLSDGKEQHPLIPTSLLKLRKGNSLSISIPDLAQELAISQRQLDRLYRTQVGMSPKQYLQLQRVETARLSLKELQEKSATELAYDLGFYDQSHFIREFKAVIGMTPYKYMQRSQGNS